MKKFFLPLIALLLIGTSSIKAQNLQVHYDFGEKRKLTTATLEMFKPDKYGSTFFFVDMDFGGNKEDGRIDGMNLAYWEIARSLKWNENQKFEPRVEFNGGMGRGDGFSYKINNAWLVGGQYTLNNADFSKVLTLQANAKYISDGKIDNGETKDMTSYQFTAVWALHFFERKISVTGFADFWREDHGVVDKDGNWSTSKYVFLTEPQIWYNTCDQFSIGGELEMSNDFGTNKGFMINPTLAVKWTF
ncbi:DUF5020 family protein [Carboxylicivirga sp. N1Y90]|uniref:DUF5020 family protein n=1 Tax=Carboxylicivirga fragile TaxID=3417571 RepID=UPI003D34AC8B|nr:DUF5020 family protein [Marinilabiliaceae bacterium N1Y90]